MRIILFDKIIQQVMAQVGKAQQGRRLGLEENVLLGPTGPQIKTKCMNIRAE